MSRCCCDRPIPLHDGVCLKCGRDYPARDELAAADVVPSLDDADTALLERLGVADYRAAFRTAAEPPDLP